MQPFAHILISTGRCEMWSRNIFVKTVSTLMLSHILTSSKYVGRSYMVFHCLDVQRQPKELLNRGLNLTSCRKLVVFWKKNSHSPEVHLESALSSNKIIPALPPLFAFALTHSSYLASHNNPLRFTPNLTSGQIGAMDTSRVGIW